MWKSKIDRARAVVIPNGVDLAVFEPSDGPPTRWQVVVPSRFDSDKRYLVEMLVETWSLAAEEPDSWADVHWLIVGDGTEMPLLRTAAAVLDNAVGQTRVEFVGWQAPKHLARLLAGSAAAVAPGRSALESLACGVPTVALGSRGYVGLIDGAEALRGLHTNFGRRRHLNTPTAS